MPMEVLELPPYKIKVREGLDRFREDMGDIEKLKESIVRTRQILPIVITREYELIDGGRRLAACLLAGINVKAVFEDVVDDYEMRVLELEANLYRKEYTPAEEAQAIKELHQLKQEKFGKGESGTTAGWSIQDTANLLGKSRGSVYNALEMAAIVDVFPQLKAATKKSEIKKAAKGLIKLDTALKGLKKHEEAISESKETFELVLGDAVGHMEACPDSSIDILLTDPIYGINADLIGQTVGGKTGGAFSTSGFKIDDDRDLSYYYYHVLAHQGIRFTTPQCHGYVFIGPEHFWRIRDIFLEVGWRVHVKPLIWIKRAVGQCNVPTAWPASCYEMVMYIRKDDSKIVKEGQPDWIECPPVGESQRLHPYEKPVPLLLNLLERVSLPGQTLYDPFMGSASSIEAGTKLKLFSIGVDNSKEAYANACARMANAMEEDKNEHEQERQENTAG